MKRLRKLANKPIIGPIIKKLIDRAVNKEVSTVVDHFSRYLSPVVASASELREQAFQIRHQVYCEELKFEELRDNRQETDEVDAFSLHCLIRHISTGDYAGTVRVVRPTKPEQQLPIEKYCLDSIQHKDLRPDNFERHQICEISRLAVPEQFRRRKMDKFNGAATGSINEHTYSEEELRCFPFIAVGLYVTAASLILIEGIEHTYVMMEPRLARSMSFVGIHFEQLGPVVEYHGKRAPYYINPKLFSSSVSPGFKKMLEHIYGVIEKQQV